MLDLGYRRKYRKAWDIFAKSDKNSADSLANPIPWGRMKEWILPDPQSFPIRGVEPMQKHLIRILCLLLVLAMMVPLVGCQDPLDPTGFTDPPTEPDTEPPTEAPTDPPVLYYTYRDYLTTAPTCFDPLTWKTEQDQYILEHTTMGLYDLILNEAGSGYAFQPEMAAGEPVDVTQKYAGHKVYGVPSAATSGYAWQIDLNPQAVWEDGTPINADTYMKSMERLLYYKDKNPHAQQFYKGELALANAYDYCMQEYAGYVQYKTLAEAGYNNDTKAINDGHEIFVDTKAFWNMDCGWLSANDKTKYRDESVPEDSKEAYISGYYLYNTYLKSGQSQDMFQTLYLGIQTHNIQKRTFDQVGICKTGDYQITLILAKPISAQGLMANLRNAWIVPEELYAQGGYGTEIGKYLSCGPYRLEAVETGKSLTLVQNEKWYGYTDGKHTGQYQTQTIYCRILPTHAEAVYRYEKGELDRLVLADGDMEKYGDNPQIYTVPKTQTTKLTLNSDYTKLAKRQKTGINKTILNITAFRQGLSMCIDRAAFVAATDKTASPSLGLFSKAYICDAATGTVYRDSENGQTALQSVYGVDEQGNLTAFDPKKAGEKMVEGYNFLLEKKMIGKKDVITLEVMVYSNSTFYQNVVAHLQSSVDAAVAGTVLEGRVKFVLGVNTNFYTRARNGNFDIILSTLSGSELDPWSMMSYYCDPAQRFEYGYDPESVNLKISGKTRNVFQWYELLRDEYSEPKNTLRNNILSALERSILSTYRCIPLYDHNVLTIYSQKVSSAVSQNSPLLDAGDMRFISFVYDDALWEQNN
jgi:ABC-type oligopeptide transport system substrate-binding subunit